MTHNRPRRRVLGRLLVSYACLLTGVVGVSLLLPAGVDENDPTPVRDPAAPLLVALGDSFMSGEGANRYLPDTNVSANRCHRATTAHPYLVAAQLGMRLVAATCSGATTADLVRTAQYQHSPRTTHGGLPQLNVLDDPRISPDSEREPGSPSIVLVGIGGNDAEFGNIVRSCLDTDCRPQLRSRIARLDTEVQPNLAGLYARIRAKVSRQARVLVMTYPQPVVDSACVPGLSRAEIRELTERFLPRLNEVIRFQASRPEVGFEVVEVENTFVGVRLCESRNAAMNGLKVTPGSGSASTSGSMHPNEIGHLLLARAVLTHLSQPPNLIALGPWESPRQAPPFTENTLPPGTSVDMPPSSPCSTRGAFMEFDNVRPLVPEERSVRFDADPGSKFCISIGSEDWLASAVGANGIQHVDVRRLTEAAVSTIQVIRLVDGQWRVQVLTPPIDALPRPPLWFTRISVWFLVLLAAPLVVGGVVWTIRRVRRS